MVNRQAVRRRSDLHDALRCTVFSPHDITIVQGGPSDRRRFLDETLEIVDHDYADLTGVDAKLVRMARERGAKLVTNDYNLNRVAQVEGVTVLNINELAGAVKPVVLPGEELHVTIIRDGKEPHQGVGYLDDGTMIVVENARRLIGEDTDVQVTSVLQTVAGRMIFAKVKHKQQVSTQ